MAAASVPRKLILHVVHVGAGLANIIEVEEDEISGVKFYLYDGGSSDFNILGKNDNLKHALQLSLSGHNEQQGSSLDGIIVSHPDADHFNLIAKLFEQGHESSEQMGNVMLSGDIKFTGQVVLTQAFSWKKTKDCTSFMQSLSQLNFKPVLVAGKEVKGNHNVIKMATCFTLYFPLSNDGCSGTVYGKNISDKDELKTVEEDGDKSNFDYNKSSTILKIGKVAILTGDAHAENFQEDSVKCKDGSVLKVFHVPHHGSRRQYIEQSYKQWKYLLVYRALLKYQRSGRRDDLIGHLSYERRKDAVRMYEEAYFSLLWINLVNIVNKESDSIHKQLDKLFKASTRSINPPQPLVKSYREMRRKLKQLLIQKRKRDPETRLKSEVDALFNCLESTDESDQVESIADFYKDFPAQTYVISCGTRYNHPHEEVMSGIILSVIREHMHTNKKRKCSLLVVSGSACLKDKIVRLPSDIDAEKFSELVSIKYLSRGNISRVPIDLLSDDDPLYSNNDLKTWPWITTPEFVDSSYATEIFCGEEDASLYSGNSGRVMDEDEDPPLSEYLKVVNPSLNPKEMKLSSVLQLLVGPPVERKLSESLSKHSTLSSTLLIQALKMNVKEESEFVLSGETHRQSAKSAKLLLQLPESSLSFMEMNVQAINVEVQNAKCLDMSLKVDVELAPEGKVRRTMLLDFSELCLDFSSIGRPLSILLSEIDRNSKACEYTVGALLGLILGGARARHLICSFPIKLSASLAVWKLDLNSTVIDFDADEKSLHFRGAFIVGSSPTQTHPIKFNSTLIIEPTTLEIKLPPLLPHSTDGVDISGHCTVNKICAKYRALSKSYASSEVEIEFCDKLSPADMLDFFGIVDNSSSSDYQIQVLQKRLDQCSVVSTGFTIEQPAEYYPDTTISSVFFQLDPESIDVHCLLPDYLKKHLRLNAVRAVSRCPSNLSQLGLESVFICDISIPMELKLQILSLNEKDTGQHPTSGLMCHSYLLSLRPLPILKNEDGKVKVVTQPSLVDIVETLCPECNFKEVLLSFPKLHSILDYIHLKYFHTQVNPSLQSLLIQQFELKLYVPCLEIIPHKLTIEAADVEFFYSKDCISVSSDSRIIVFGEYVCSVSFSLPTRDREGQFSIRNYSNDLTLKRGLEGFGISASISELPLFSTLLEISIKCISLTLDHDYSIVKAELTIYKEEISLGRINMSEVELTAEYTKNTTSPSLNFTLQGFIGEFLFATLSYKSFNNVLSGSIAVQRKAGEMVKLSSFLAVIGLHKPDIPENIEELFSFMDLEVQSASISIKMCPSVTIKALELELKSGGSIEFSIDPKIILHEVKLHALYNENDGLKISVEGIITLSSVVVTLQGATDPNGVSLKGSVEQPFNFINAIDGLRASQSEPLVIPSLTDIHQKLSKMCSLEFSIRLEKDRRMFMIECFSCLEVSLSLGSCVFTLQTLGAKVSVTTGEKSSVQYSGYICGQFSVYNLQAEARLALLPEGEGKDIIFIGCCQRVDAMNLELLTEAIERVPLSTSQPQTQLSNISLGCNMPRNILDVGIENAVLAANITQKQLIFYLKLKEIGCGLLIFSDHNKECLIGISLPHGFKLRQISEILAPIDNILKVKELHLLICTMESANLDGVMNSFHKVATESDTLKSAFDAFNEDEDCIKGIEGFQQAPPFASFRSTDTVYVREKELKRGFYLYCKLDMPALNESESLFSDVIQLSKSGFPDIVLSMYIGQGGFKEGNRELSMSAFIPSINLLGDINFSNVYLEYKMSQHSEVTLSGELSINLGEQSCITIVGCMHISKEAVKFSAEYPQRNIDSITSPLEVPGITLQNIRCEVELRKKNRRLVYTIALKGKVKFMKPPLSFESSVVFKDGRPALIAMSLEGTLRLSNFLKAAFDFEGISQDSYLDIALHNGHLVYAREPIPYEGYNTSKGYNATCMITVMKREFKITASFTRKPAVQFTIQGYMVGGAIDILGLIQLKNPNFSSDSVELDCSYNYESGERFKLFLSAGVSLLNYDVCNTKISYTPPGIFEGEVECAFEFLSKMSIGFQWCKEDGFKIVKWPAVGELPIQKVLNIIEAVYDIVSLIIAASTGGLSAIITCIAKYIFKKCFKFGFEMNAKLEENPDPETYRVIIALKLSFVVRFIGKKIFEADAMELKVKIGKRDGLAQLPKRILDAFIDWIKEKFSQVFSTLSESDDSIDFDCVTIPLDVLSLDQFHKHFRDFTRVIHAVSVLSLNIKAISAMDKERQAEKKDEKKKLEMLLERYQKWLKDQKELIDTACKLRAPPNVILYSESPQRLQATWSPPLKGDSKQYSYDVRVRAVDSSGFTREIVSRTLFQNSFVCDDTRIAEATKIHVAVRSSLNVPISMWYEEGTTSSDENYLLVGEWSEAIALKHVAKPDVLPKRKMLELKPPERVSIVYDDCSKFITGEISLNSVSDFSVIIVQLLEGERVISTQPNRLSELRTEGQEKIIKFAFNTEVLSVISSEARGPLTVQAQVCACDDSEGAYVRSDFTRSSKHITRAKQPEWNTFQYDPSEDTIVAIVKSFDDESQCSVEFMEGISIKEGSEVLKIPVSSQKDNEGKWHFSADVSYFREKLNPGSDKLTCSAHVESTVNKLGSRPIFSWPRMPPIFLLPRPSGLKTKYIVSDAITSHGCLQLQWDTLKGVSSFLVGLTEVSTSHLLHSEYVENSQCIIIDIDKFTTALYPFECFVSSFGDAKHISSEKVMSGTVFYPLNIPFIQNTEFDYSTSTLTVTFEGDRRASHFSLQYTLAYYHSRQSITKMMSVEQMCNSLEEQQECSICFEEDTLHGCSSIQVSVQAVGGGSYISSRCQTLEGKEEHTAIVPLKSTSSSEASKQGTSCEPIPSPEWTIVLPNYQEDWTVTTLDVIWPKRFTLRQQCGLMICSETNTIVWSINSFDFRTTISLSAVVSPNTSCLQLQVYVKNIGDYDVISDPMIDPAVYYGCLLSEMFVFFTGVSLQRVATLSNGNSLTQRCLSPKRKLHELVTSGKQFSSPLRVLFDKQADSEMGLEVQMLKYHKDLDQRLKKLHKKIQKWQHRENDDDTMLTLEVLRAIQAEKTIEWEENLTEQTNTIKDLERNVHLLMSISRGRGIILFPGQSGESELQPLQNEVERVLKLAKSAKANLWYWEGLTAFLHELKRHMDFIKHQETHLKSCRREFLSRKSTLGQSLVYLNELKTFSDDCNNYDNIIIHECECAFETCETGIRQCNLGIKTIKEGMDEVETEQERVLGEVIRCEENLCACTINLQKHHDMLLQWMKETAEELDSDAYVTRAAANSVGTAVETIKRGGFFGALAVVAVGVATGGIGLAAGAVAGTAAAYAAAKRDQQTKLARIYQCRDELKESDKIIKECWVGIGHMKETIAGFKSNTGELAIDTFDNN